MGFAFRPRAAVDWQPQFEYLTMLEKRCLGACSKKDAKVVYISYLAERYVVARMEWMLRARKPNWLKGERLWELTA
jgi:hypothetical protein